VVSSQITAVGVTAPHDLGLDQRRQCRLAVRRAWCHSTRPAPGRRSAAFENVDCCANRPGWDRARWRRPASRGVLQVDRRDPLRCRGAGLASKSIRRPWPSPRFVDETRQRSVGPSRWTGCASSHHGRRSGDRSQTVSILMTVEKKGAGWWESRLRSTPQVLIPVALVDESPRGLARPKPREIISDVALMPGLNGQTQRHGVSRPMPGKCGAGRPLGPRRDR